jgi:hypothetical protein
VGILGSLIVKSVPEQSDLTPGFPEEDSNRLAVWCWEFSPVCYLTWDHRKFDRIRTTLEQVASSGGRVWFANWMRLVEDDTEIWWQILDAQPVEALPPERLRRTRRVSGMIGVGSTCAAVEARTALTLMIPSGSSSGYAVVPCPRTRELIIAVRSQPCPERISPRRNDAAPRG